METYIFIPLVGLLIWNLSFEYVDTTSSKSHLKLFHYALPNMRPLERALGFNEDTYLNFTELASKYNYPTEQHQCVTEDGYVLTLFRIRSKCNCTVGYPVILLHGIYDSSDTFVLAGAKSGLGFVLAAACFDVWAANHRGNVYSRKHVLYDPNRDPEFWNYSFDEHGFYDLPAMIDYVTETTKLPKVNYIGHSQGTTDFFVMASLKPAYNKKLRLSIHLAPVVFMRNVNNPILKLLSNRVDEIKKYVDEARIGELLAKHQLTHTFTEFACQFAPEPICGTLLYAATGYKRGTISAETLSIAFGHLFAGVSTKSLAHLGQLMSSRKFQRYDEGKQGNDRRYGSIRPPEYNLSRVTSPIILVAASNDGLSTLDDVTDLASMLPNLKENYIVPDPTWSHNNHLWGKDAQALLFPRILKYLKFDF